MKVLQEAISSTFLKSGSGRWRQQPGCSASDSSTGLLCTLTVLALVVAGSADAAGQPRAAFVAPTLNQGPPRAIEVHVVRERQVAVRLDLLDGITVGAAPESLRLDFFPDVSYTAALNRVTRTASGFAWSGNLVGVPSSTAVFARVGQSVAGFVTSPFGQYSLEDDGARGHIVQQRDSWNRWAAEAAPILLPSRGTSSHGSHSDGTGDDVGTARASPTLASSSTVSAGQSVMSVIDVLVAYTPGAVAAEPGGIDALKAKSLVMIALADAALRTAGIGSVRLAGTMTVDLDGGCDEYGEMLDWFRELETVRTALDHRAADVATLVPDLNDCAGIAFLGYPEADWRDIAFNIVGRIAMNGTVFAHELGHNMGLLHQWDDDDGKWYWPWARGHVSEEGGFLTIMAVGSCAPLHCVDAPIYSDPGMEYRGHPAGVPIGTSTACTANNPDNPPCDADAASTLREVAPIVAAIRRHDSHLQSGSSLSPGQFLRPQGAGPCLLKYQSDGNLVAYFTDGTPYWSSRTAGSSAGSVVMEDDGDLVVYDSLGAARWASGTHGNPGAKLSIQRDCNLVVRAADGKALWASGAPPLPELGSLNLIQAFYAEPATIQSGGSSQIVLEGVEGRGVTGFVKGLLVTHPNGEQERLTPSYALLSSYSFPYNHRSEWGTGTATFEAEFTDLGGERRQTATITLTVSP